MIETKYRADMEIKGEPLGVHMAFSTEGETVEECDEKARAELAKDAHTLLKGSKWWVLRRESWTEIPALTETV